MEAEPSGGASLPISQGRKHSFRSDGSEEAIQACYDLLSSGQPLTEILVALKRLGPLNKAQLAPCVAAFDTRNLDLSSERRSHQWAIDQATPFVEANLSLVPLNISQSQLLPHNREKQSNKDGRRAIGTALFWLIPAMSLMLLAGAGKLLHEAVVLQNVEFLTAVTETTAPRSSITAVSNIASHIAPEQFAAARA